MTDWIDDLTPAEAIEMHRRPMQHASRLEGLGLDEVERIAEKAKAAEAADEYKKLRLVQTRGPTIQAQAKALAWVEFEKRGQVPVYVTLEVYETPAGALIAVRRSDPIEFEGVEDVRALVVEPQEDVQAMHWAVMEHMQWEDRARTMARKLGWKLTRKVA